MSGNLEPNPQVGGVVKVPVRLSVPSTHRLVNFQIVVSFDSDVLTSKGGTFSSGSFSGVDATLDDPPNQFQLVASHLQSTMSGVVDLGTATLPVVGSGVTLIEGYVVEIITIDELGHYVRISNVATVAGMGFAEVHSSRRELRSATSSNGLLNVHSVDYRRLRRASEHRARSRSPSAPNPSQPAGPL